MGGRIRIGLGAISCPCKDVSPFIHQHSANGYFATGCGLTSLFQCQLHICFAGKLLILRHKPLLFGLVRRFFLLIAEGIQRYHFAGDSRFFAFFLACFGGEVFFFQPLQ